MRKEKQGAGFHLLMHSAHLLDDRLRERLAPLGLHAGQARFIHALGRVEEASQRQLASEFNVTAASMSQMTKRLIQNGFIQQRHDPKDKRAAFLSLTEQGSRLRDEIEAAWRDIDRIIIEALGPENADQLFAQSGNLRDALGGKAPMADRGSKPLQIATQKGSRRSS